MRGRCLFYFLDWSGLWEIKLVLLLSERWVSFGFSSHKELLGHSFGELNVRILALFVHNVDGDEEHAF